MRKAWVMKQPFEKLVERHGGTVGRHVDVSELIESATAGSRDDFWLH